MPCYRVVVECDLGIGTGLDKQFAINVGKRAVTACGLMFSISQERRWPGHLLPCDGVVAVDQVGMDWERFGHCILLLVVAKSQENIIVERNVLGYKYRVKEEPGTGFPSICLLALEREESLK